MSVRSSIDVSLNLCTRTPTIVVIQFRFSLHIYDGGHPRSLLWVCPPSLVILGPVDHFIRKIVRCECESGILIL